MRTLSSEAACGVQLTTPRIAMLSARGEATQEGIVEASQMSIVGAKIKT